MASAARLLKARQVFSGPQAAEQGLQAPFSGERAQVQGSEEPSVAEPLLAGRPPHSSEAHRLPLAQQVSEVEHQVAAVSSVVAALSQLGVASSAVKLLAGRLLEVSSEDRALASSQARPQQVARPEPEVGSSEEQARARVEGSLAVRQEPRAKHSQRPQEAASSAEEPLQQAAPDPAGDCSEGQRRREPAVHSVQEPGKQQAEEAYLAARSRPAKSQAQLVGAFSEAQLSPRHRLVDFLAEEASQRAVDSLVEAQGQERVSEAAERRQRARVVSLAAQLQPGAQEPVVQVVVCLALHNRLLVVFLVAVRQDNRRPDSRLPEADSSANPLARAG